jgi:hypothetical protein
VSAAADAWGVLTDYRTREPICPATEADWLSSLEVLHAQGAGAYAGAWTDAAGRAVFVEGGPSMEIDDEMRPAEATPRGSAAGSGG